MSESKGFEYKIKFHGMSWDYEKNEFIDNGFVKIFYASDFNQLLDVFEDFINGENRFISVAFNEESKEYKLNKFYADENNVSHELTRGLGNALKQISDKVYFVLDSEGYAFWWDRDNKLEYPDTSTLNEFCDNEKNIKVEYIATVRLVVKKEERVI